jgi:hypothetical protein
VVAAAGDYDQARALVATTETAVHGLTYPGTQGRELRDLVPAVTATGYRDDAAEFDGAQFAGHGMWGMFLFVPTTVGCSTPSVPSTDGPRRRWSSARALRPHTCLSKARISVTPYDF